jgi:heavy metal sensor kinase
LYDIEQSTFIGSENFFAPDLKISADDIAKAVKGEYTLNKVWVKYAKPPYRLITRPVVIGNSCKYILQVGIYMKLSYKTLENMEENFLMSAPVLFIFSIVGGWFISRRGLSPIENITETTRQITTSNLDQRLVHAHTGDELERLAMTINLMLSRIEESFVKNAQFTSDVSHELRTPIASIKTGIEVILSKERTVGEYCNLLESNLIALESMTKMVSELLELSKTDSNTNIIDLRLFNLGSMLKDLQNKFMPVSDLKEIKVSVKGIPDVYINADEILLRRVFANLLDNAIKYTPHGGRVVLSLVDRGNSVAVCIKDTGVGISERNLERVFDRFFRVDHSRSRGTGGTGLGLNICKKFVELHHGKIEVQSELAVGSTFEVTLPKNITNS